MENDPCLRNIKLVISYDGTRYHGWQRQAGAASIQETIEQAAGRLLGHPVACNGASRTDAGVHALGQVGNIRTGNFHIPVRNFRRALNAKLPPDIAVLSAEEVPPDFHASRGALGKTYRYRIYLAPHKLVMEAWHVYHYSHGQGKELDAEAMRQAAGRLVGTHDFRGLAFAAEKRENTVRTITQCTVSEAEDELRVWVTGDGFLYKMVRNIVGTLVEIGRGRWGPERIDDILRTRDRAYAGQTAPASGLCLMAVYYSTLASGRANETPTGM